MAARAIDPVKEPSLRGLLPAPPCLLPPLAVNVRVCVCKCACIWKVTEIIFGMLCLVLLLLWQHQKPIIPCYKLPCPCHPLCSVHSDPYNFDEQQLAAVKLRSGAGTGCLCLLGKKGQLRRELGAACSTNKFMRRAWGSFWGLDVDCLHQIQRRNYYDAGRESWGWDGAQNKIRIRIRQLSRHCNCFYLLQKGLNHVIMLISIYSKPYVMK